MLSTIRVPQVYDVLSTSPGEKPGVSGGRYPRYPMILLDACDIYHSGDSRTLNTLRYRYLKYPGILRILGIRYPRAPGGIGYFEYPKNPGSPRVHTLSYPTLV